MKLIESKAEYITQEKGLEGIYKQIELAGRTAYHSLDKITPDSAKSFVDRMIKSKHGAALEHGTVYLKVPMEHSNIVYKYERNQYSKVGNTYDGIAGDWRFYPITTNLRVLVENNWLDDLQYLCSPTEFHEKRYTMRFTCSRAIAQELTRHRVFSFLMESQRYINYSKERHGGEINYIMPSWYLRANATQQKAFMHIIRDAESYYMALLGKWDDKKPDRRFKIGFKDNPLTPQQARDVLPNAAKTELIMTGFASDWRHVMDLRLFGKTGAPHPDMVNLMQKAQKAMQKVGIWEDIIKYPSKFDKNDSKG